MQPQKILVVDDSTLRQLAKETGIPMTRLAEARSGKIQLSADEIRRLTQSKIIKKPFGN